MTVVYQLFVGIDIAAHTATCSCCRPQLSPETAFTIDQTPTGWHTLHAHLQRTRIAPTATLVVLEATGNYGVSLATYLHAAGYVVSVMNPIQARSFAKAALQRAKTDSIDAQLLARLAVALQPTPWQPPPPVYHELHQRLRQRDALIEIRTQVLNQRHALTHGPVVSAAVLQRMDALLATLDAHIAATDHELTQVLEQEPVWATAVARLQTIPGIGYLTALWIVASTVNFRTGPTAATAVAYTGLAPRPHTSGTSVWRRGRIDRRGHARLRQALYMATLRAARHNPSVKPVYDRLRAAGKPTKVARCAAARKLIRIAWAVVTKDQDFQPMYGLPPPVPSVPVGG